MDWKEFFKISKIKLTLIIIVVLALGFYIYIFFNDNPYYFHNAQVDLSCKVDSDCTLKVIGCTCGRQDIGCANLESVDFKCTHSDMECLAMPSRPPEKCACIGNGVCAPSST